VGNSTRLVQTEDLQDFAITFRNALREIQVSGNSQARNPDQER